MRRVLPSRSDATSVLLCKASIRYLFAWKEIKPARKKGKEKERRERWRQCSRHVDSNHFWIALHGGSQRFNWIKPVATRDAPCTGSARTIRARCSSKGAVEEARDEEDRRKEIALRKISARLKPEFNTVRLMVDHPESSQSERIGRTSFCLQ